VLSGQKTAAPPHDVLYFYWGQELHAVRSGKWKLHLPHPYQSLEAAGGDGVPGKYVRKEIDLSLYDLDADPAETKNVAAANPQVVAGLMLHVERAREDLGDSLVKRTGKHIRPAGRVAVD
jgi:arylsulfatase A